MLGQGNYVWRGILYSFILKDETDNSALFCGLCICEHTSNLQSQIRITQLIWPYEFQRPFQKYAPQRVTLQKQWTYLVAQCSEPIFNMFCLSWCLSGANWFYVLNVRLETAFTRFGLTSESLDPRRCLRPNLRPERPNRRFGCPYHRFGCPNLRFGRPNFRFGRQNL